MTGRGFPPKGSTGWVGPEVLRRLINRIFERYPSATDFEPCDCGITLAVIPADSVQPEIHFVVEDVEFRDEALRMIREHFLPNSNYDGGVLVLAERA